MLDSLFFCCCFFLLYLLFSFFFIYIFFLISSFFHFYSLFICFPPFFIYEISIFFFSIPCLFFSPFHIYEISFLFFLITLQTSLSVCVISNVKMLTIWSLLTIDCVSWWSLRFNHRLCIVTEFCQVLFRGMWHPRTISPSLCLQSVKETKKKS